MENANPFPEGLEHLWAKSPEKGEGGEAESLVLHTWHVLKRFADLVRLRPSLPAEVGKEDLWHLLYWATFLHDFGKAHPDFQGVLRKERAAKERWAAHRHEVFSLPFLAWFGESLGADQRQWIIAAIVSHHREPGELHKLYPFLDDEEDDSLSELVQQMPAETLQGLWQWLRVCGVGWIESLGLNSAGVHPLALVDQEQAVRQFRQHGTKLICDYLSQYHRLVSSFDKPKASAAYKTLGILLRGYMIQSDHTASAHVEQLPFLSLSREDIIYKRGIRLNDLYTHQLQAARVQGSLILTAPTGSGKTEAALFWAANQRQAARLFYTLPYQASMNAMKLRLNALFGDFSVGLQHGRGLLALYRQLMERDYEAERAARTARWLKNLAELNVPPIRVFSPYQMLKGMYRLKGYEAQLADYYRGLFIFDEIHAYEVSRLAMILSTLKHLKRHYCARFLIMSATLPTLIRNWIQEALGDVPFLTADSALYARFQRHTLRVVEGDLIEQLSLIAQEAQAGKSVLVVCNTVGRSQEVYRRLSALLPPAAKVLLLHGRFHQRDRMAKERSIQQLFGRQKSSPVPVILVSTQVVEVSLDIDLDTLFSDPAPLEALIQRCGRVNRSGRLGATAQVHIFTEPADGQRIYSPELIQSTLSILRSHQGKAIDENQVNHWLDEIYSGKIAAEWESEFRKGVSEFEAACLDTLRPFSPLSHLENQFYRLFDGIEVLPEALYPEYERNLENESITAEEYLVPLRWGQYHLLANRGLILPGNDRIPPIVRTEYSSELGLSFDQPVIEDEWD